MPTDVNSDEITLRGDTTRFGDALAMLYERASSTVTSQITVEHWMHRLLIGPKGATLQVRIHLHVYSLLQYSYIAPVINTCVLKKNLRKGFFLNTSIMNLHEKN